MAEIIGYGMAWIFGTIAIALWFACNKLERDLTRAEIKICAYERDLQHMLKTEQ